MQQQVIELQKTVFSTEELQKLEQEIKRAGGHIVGIFNSHKGVTVTYRIPG